LLISIQNIFLLIIIFSLSEQNFKMVQGLAFLSKKSWHTKNKSNQEKVWIAEQKKEQETAKATELAREIQQEREAEELNQIAGKKSIKDRGIDWMYSEGTSTELAKEQAEKEAEQFLLGKEFVGEGAVQGVFHDGNQKEGIHNALSKTEAGIKQQELQKEEKSNPFDSKSEIDTVHSRNENFRLRVQDPMFLVSQKQQEKKDKHEQVKSLYHRVVGPVEDSSDDGSMHEEKRRKKERKRQKKKKKKKKSRRSCKKEEYERRHSRLHRGRSRSCSTSRSRSNERYGKQYKGDDRDCVSRSDNSYDSRRDRYRDRNHDRMKRCDRKNRRQYDEGKNTSYHSDGKDNNNYSRMTRRDHNDERSSRKNTPYPKQDGKTTKIEGYGLKGVPAPVPGSRDIGPSKELLRKKKEEIKHTRLQNNKIGRSRKILTVEERAIALQQMQSDARTRKDRMGRQASYRANDTEEEMTSSRKGASFLNDITSRTHGIDGPSSLSSRVAQNRHTNQRLNDSFL